MHTEEQLFFLCRILSVLTFLGGVGVLINTIPHFALPAENNSGSNQTQQDLLTCPAGMLLDVK